MGPEHRQVVVLRYFADMTVPEVAQDVWSERGHREIAAVPGAPGVAAAIGRRAAVAEVIDEL